MLDKIDCLTLLHTAPHLAFTDRSCPTFTPAFSDRRIFLQQPTINNNSPKGWSNEPYNARDNPQLLGEYDENSASQPPAWSFNWLGVIKYLQGFDIALNRYVTLWALAAA